jgi:hypothetical protein
MGQKEMSGWYKVTLSVEEVASGRGMRLQEDFTKLYAVAGGPVGAAMFRSNHVMSNDYYFSPVAASIAMALIIAHHGKPCDAPARSAVRPLVQRADDTGIPFAHE